VEPALPDAPLEEAKPEMAALEQTVERGVRIEPGKASMQDGQIVLPVELQTKDSREKYQLRISINMDAPVVKRFRIVVKGIK
jgi:hypothetical protein